MVLLKKLLFYFVVFLFLSLIIISFMRIDDVIIKEILVVTFCISATGMKIFNLVSSYGPSPKRKTSDYILYIANITVIIAIISLLISVTLFHVEVDLFVVALIFGLGIFIPIPNKAS